MDDLSRLSFQKAEQSFFLIRPAFHGQHPVPRGVDDRPERSFVDGFFCQDHCLSFCMGRCDLLCGERPSDGIVDVGFAHPAHHAVDFNCDLIHEMHLLSHIHIIFPGTPALNTFRATASKQFSNKYMRCFSGKSMQETCRRTRWKVAESWVSNN